MWQNFTTFLHLPTFVYNFVEGASICPSRALSTITSGHIYSPGYPTAYNTSKSVCSLTLLIPDSSVILFLVDGEYKLPGSLKGCTTQESLYLHTPREMISFCGSRDLNTVLGNFYADEVANVSLVFNSTAESHSSDSRFRMKFICKLVCSLYNAWV